MTCLWILSFLHIFILAAVSPAAETIPGGVATCEELAAKAGKPVNGWKIIVDANGDQQCQRITVDLMCLGQQIYDPITRASRCCNPPRLVTWIDQAKELGYCCAQGHQWTGDASTGFGGCCPNGFTWTNGKCQSPSPDPNGNGGDRRQVPLGCPDGYRLHNGQCMPELTSDGCPIGYGTQTNGVCVTDTPPTPGPTPGPVQTTNPPVTTPTCPPGYIFANGACIPDIASPGPQTISTPIAPATCPPGYISGANGVCTPAVSPPSPIPTTSTPCPSGHALVDGVCIPTPAPPQPPNSPVPVGGTCPAGYTFVNGACVQNVNPTPDARGGCPPGTQLVNGACAPVAPPANCASPCPSPSSAAACGGPPVCANANDLGLEYGRCYTLSFSDGTQFGAQRDNEHTYAKGGYFQNIPFKVCRSTTDCSESGRVPHGGAFSLQDQAGRFDDPTGKLGWINDAADGGHMAWTDEPGNAAVFQGSAACAGGECAVKLNGGVKGEKSVGPACPADQHGLTMWANPNMGENLRFTETRCDGKSAFAPQTAKSQVA